jgi:hypothetical protein
MGIKPPATREIVDRDGKPVADLEDLKALEELRREPLKLRRLEDFLAEYSPNA